MYLLSPILSLVQATAVPASSWTWVESAILLGIAGTASLIAATLSLLQQRNRLDAARKMAENQAKELTAKSAALREEITKAAAAQLDSTSKQLYTELDQAEDRVATLEQASLGLQAKNALLEKDKKELLGQSEALTKDILEIKRANPTFQRVVYNVGFIGIASSGKSVIVLKMVDPSFQEFNTIKPTDVVELYDRTVVVQQHPRDFRRQQHVFRFREWGGEHLVRAQTDMLNLSQAAARIEKENLLELDGMHGIVFVVDLGLFPDGTPIELRHTTPHVLSETRIKEQYTKYFNENAIKFLLNDKVLNSCHAVVLFINKCDLLDQFPHDEVEHAAEEYYRELIMLLRSRFADLVVIVGSANTEAGLHRLYATLVSKILSNLRGVDSLGVADKYRRAKPSASERPVSAAQAPADAAEPMSIDPTLDPQLIAMNPVQTSPNQV